MSTVTGEAFTPMLTEKEFFVRKAIGWVLRETARKDPAELRGVYRKRAEP